jgi:hypothetical protein
MSYVSIREITPHAGKEDVLNHSLHSAEPTHRSVQRNLYFQPA